jgi:hypothetical protein
MIGTLIYFWIFGIFVWLIVIDTSQNTEETFAKAIFWPITSVLVLIRSFRK